MARLRRSTREKSVDPCQKHPGVAQALIQPLKIQHLKQANKNYDDMSTKAFVCEDVLETPCQVDLNNQK